MQHSAVILAGGESKRMGRDKAWVEFAGRPLIAHAVDTITALGVREIFISGRAGQDFSTWKLPVLFDLEPGFGPLGGIERALHECQSPLLLVLAVDLPNMTPEFLHKLTARCDRLTGVIPKLNGELEPLAAIYPKRCRAFAFSAIARSRHAAREFATACWREQAVRTYPVPDSEVKCLANCNLPADLTGG